ncbi:MAG TPA: hypothetical protein VF550_10665, partial [Polyangia bacterium]
MFDGLSTLPPTPLPEHAGLIRNPITPYWDGECEAGLQEFVEFLGMLDIRGVSRVLNDMPDGSVAGEAHQAITEVQWEYGIVPSPNHTQRLC